MKKRIALLILVVSIAILVGTLTACSGDPRCVDGHSWFDVAEVQVADCTNPGIVYGRCSKCGIRRMPETPALGHDLVLVPGTAIEPTCDEDGYEGDFECARDNCTHLEHGAIIPALGHKDEDGDGNCDNCGGNPCNHVWGDWTDNGDGTHSRTCTLDSSHVETAPHNIGEGTIHWITACECETEYSCQDCDYSYMGAPSLFHDYPDTWTDNEDGTHIKVCGNGCGEYLIENHTYVEVSRTEADCENEGVVVYECECGSGRVDMTPAHGHAYGEWIDDENGTSHTRVCANDSAHTETENHNHEETGRVDADCENDGTITYTCVCGNIKTETIPATGHAYGQWIDDENGTSHTRVCANDNAHTETENHNLVEINRTPATCTEAEKITSKCEDCGFEYSIDVAPALGHDYPDTWTDNGDGAHIKVCGNGCGVDLIETHTHGETDRTPADCLNAEVITYTCVCGNSYTEDGEPALGHDYPDTWTDNGDNHIKVCANGCGIDLTESHQYLDTWTEDGTGITGKHIKTCTAEGCDHTIEEEHIFESEENYYSKKVGTWTNAAGTDTRDLIDVFWGKYCSTCGWVQIEEMPRKVDSTDVELLFDNCEIATEVNSNAGVVENFVVYPVSDFDQMYRLMTYGYSVKLINDIEIPATGNNPQLGSNETGGYKAITVNQGTFRGMQYPFVILDLDEYTLSSTFVGSTNGSGVYTQYAPLRTNTSMLIDGTNGGSINVKELVLVNNGGSIVEFRGGTYTSEGNNIADMNSTSAEVYASRVYVKDPTTTFIVADTDDAEIFTASYKRPAPEEGETGRMIAVLDAGVYYHWQPSTYNTDGWISMWVRHVENYDAERDAYIIPYEHNYNSRKVITEATCEADGLGQWYCGCGDTEGTTYTIPALGHDYVWTDNGDGTHIKVCANGCGVNLTEAHTHEETDRVDATCENDGTITYTCVCGNIKTETIPALGHTVYPSDYTACIVCGKNTYSSSYKVNITDYIGRYGFICYSDVAKSGRKLDGAEDSLGNVFMWNDGRTIRRIYEHGVVIQAGVNAETVAFMLPSGNYLALDNDGNIISVPEVNEYSSWTYSGGALQNLATNLYLAGPVDQHSPFTTTPELDLEKTKMQFNLFAEKITVLDCEHDYVIKEEVAGNCVEVGYIIYDCVICGHLYEEKTTLGDHNYVWTDNGDGTCTGICQNDNSHTVTEEHTITSDGSCSHCGWQEYEATSSYTLDGVSGTRIVSTGKDFKGGDAVIPSTINGEQVLMIGNTWNDGVSLLTDEQKASITSEKSLQV